MKTRILALTVAFALATSFSVAQQSDFEIKERFKAAYETLRHDIDSARTKEQTAQIPNRIKGLETEYADHAALIAGAFYPKTFDSMIRDLQEQYTVAQERNTTIQDQGERITILEGQLAGLTAEIEKLTAERKDLMAQLKSANLSLAQQRALVKALSVNLAAKDRLVNAMVDSIFLPFGKNMDALTEVQKDALGKKLESTGMIARIADIANDNVRFLEATKLEAKDFSTLVSQYDQFKSRWMGLRDKVSEAALASIASTAKKGKKSQQTPQENPADQVDAALSDWHAKLDAAFWASLMDEFRSRNVLVQPFNDSRSFSASIRSYVESAQKSGEDTKVFVDEIWIQRIDKDWRSALESESMIGKLEYASLDKTVSQLHKEKFNWSILWWALNLLAAGLVVWWFMTRRPKTAQQPAPAKPNV